jgi:phenylalanine-4-hydroxylase
VSSHSESVYSLQCVKPPRIAFDLVRIMRTRYRIDDFQEAYFVIDGFDQLFEATAPDFAPIYEHVRSLTEIAPGDVIAEDRVLTGLT